MKDNLQWFVHFCAEWNGISMIPRSDPNKFIYVDTSLTGIGAHDGTRAYAAQIGGHHHIARNIAELEAINDEFIDKSYVTLHEKVFCNNEASVHILKPGKGKNKTILQVACSIWMLQAHFNITITY